MSDASLDPGHQLWVQARKQLSEYELRAAELQMELQNEMRACQLAQDQLARAAKEMHQLRSAKAQNDSRALADMTKIQALQQSREAEVADTQRLVQQLGMAKQKLEAAKAALQAFKDESLKHVNEQLAHNDQLRAMLQIAPTAA